MIGNSIYPETGVLKNKNNNIFHNKQISSRRQNITEKKKNKIKVEKTLHLTNTT